MYTIEKARELLAKFKTENPEALNPRIETRHDGSFRCVYDHFITRGKQGRDKSEPITRHLVAGWGMRISPELWEAIDQEGGLTAQQAIELRAAIEPSLPARWRFRENWFAIYENEKFGVRCGQVWVVCAGKKTLVTSHCYE